MCSFLYLFQSSIHLIIDSFMPKWYIKFHHSSLTSLHTIITCVFIHFPSNRRYQWLHLFHRTKTQCSWMELFSYQDPWSARSILAYFTSKRRLACSFPAIVARLLVVRTPTYCTESQVRFHDRAHFSVLFICSVNSMLKWIPDVHLGVKWGIKRNLPPFLPIPWLRMVPLQWKNPKNSFKNGK